MSTLEQITKLIDAGYNKAEIAELLAAETQEKAEDTQPEQAAAAVSDAETITTKESAVTPDANTDRIDAAIAKMEKLAESMAKISIMNSQQPERESQDDFLAKIINPYYNKEEK